MPGVKSPYPPSHRPGIVPLTVEQKRRLLEEYSALPRGRSGRVLRDLRDLLRRKWGLSRAMLDNLLAKR